MSELEPFISNQENYPVFFGILKLGFKPCKKR